MIDLLNPFLVGGLAAVSAPIIIHLLHRRKVKVVDWAGMRFLMELLAKSRRRMFLEELLLLVLRTLIVACVALAMVRPAFLGWSGPAVESSQARQGRTGAVLLVDDSVSAAAGRAQPAFENMKKLALAYLDSLAPGDEVSVLRLSRLGGETGDPVFDLESLRAQVGTWAASSAASDIPALLEAGLAQLKRHVNPGAELVLLTDGRKDGWRLESRGQWEELRDRLRGPKTAAPGSRRRPQVIVLSPEALPAEDNLAVVGIAPDRTLVTAGRPAGVRVSVANFGREARQATVRLTVEGQTSESRRLELPPGGEQQTVFAHTFPTPGSYGVEAELTDTKDSLPADDRRSVSISAEASVPALLIEDSPAASLESKLGFLACALDPEGFSGLKGTGPAEGTPPGPAAGDNLPGSQSIGPFALTRISTAQFLPSALSQYRLVVLGDLGLMEPSAVEALERFVVGGGGVLVGLGPRTDPGFVNRYWARSGEGFLPAPLGSAVTLPKPAVPAGVNLAHPVFGGFPARTDDAWKAGAVRAYYKLEGRLLKEGDLATLLQLDNGDPLLVERRRGLGLVSMLTTSLNADWTDLPLLAAYVPLFRGVAGHLGSFIVPPRNLSVGDRVIFARLKVPPQEMKAEGPDGKPVKLELGGWEGRDAVLSEPLMTPGLYALRDPKENLTIRYAVTVSSSESSLAPLADREMDQAFNGAANLLHSPEQVVAKLDPSRRDSVELWKWLLACGGVLMFLEAWLTRRMSETA